LSLFTPIFLDIITATLLPDEPGWLLSLTDAISFFLAIVFPFISLFPMVQCKPLDHPVSEQEAPPFLPLLTPRDDETSVFRDTRGQLRSPRYCTGLLTKLVLRSRRVWRSTTTLSMVFQRWIILLAPSRYKVQRALYFIFFLSVPPLLPPFWTDSGIWKVFVNCVPILRLAFVDSFSNF